MWGHRRRGPHRVFPPAHPRRQNLAVGRPAESEAPCRQTLMTPWGTQATGPAPRARTRPSSRPRRARRHARRPDCRRRPRLEENRRPARARQRASTTGSRAPGRSRRFSARIRRIASRTTGRSSPSRKLKTGTEARGNAAVACIRGMSLMVAVLSLPEESAAPRTTPAGRCRTRPSRRSAMSGRPCGLEGARPSRQAGGDVEAHDLVAAGRAWPRSAPWVRPVSALVVARVSRFSGAYSW